MPRGATSPTTRLRLPPPPRRRRSHAERRAATRARIIDAVVDAIAELGFQRTTAQVVAARSGMTWGAVQHHFGGKEGLMLAVLEDSFNRFAERLEDVDVEHTTLEQRAALFVARAWEHFRGRHFRSTFEILVGYLGRAPAGGGVDWRTQMAVAWDGVWSRIFADAAADRARNLVLQRFTIATLSGLAETRMLAGTPAREPKAELALLRDLLARELTHRTR